VKKVSKHLWKEPLTEYLDEKNTLKCSTTTKLRIV